MFLNHARRTFLKSRSFCVRRITRLRYSQTTVINVSGKAFEFIAIALPTVSDWWEFGRRCQQRLCCVTECPCCVNKCACCVNAWMVNFTRNKSADLIFFLTQAEIKMKNRNSWSNLAQAWGVKPGGAVGQGAGSGMMSAAPQLPRPTNAAGSFETFKKQAEERKHMMTLLKQQEEQRRMEKEQMERQKQRWGWSRFAKLVVVKRHSRHVE